MVYNPLDTTDTMSASEDSQSYNQIDNYSNSVEKIMTIRERTEAARGAYLDTLRSHTGPMKTLWALKSAAQCFFSSRRVINQQELNVTTVSQTPTKPEIEESADTNIDERNAKVLDMQAELKSVLKKRAGQTQNDEDAQAEPVAPATTSTASIYDQKPENRNMLDNQAAHQKNKVRPPKRRPRTRNPGRR